MRCYRAIQKQEYEQFVRSNLGFMNYVPIIFTSAKHTTNVDTVIDVALDGMLQHMSHTRCCLYESRRCKRY
jgi:predicted GTPase